MKVELIIVNSFDNYTVETEWKFLPQKGDFIYLHPCHYEVTGIKYCFDDLDSNEYTPSKSPIVIYIKSIQQLEYCKKIGVINEEIDGIIAHNHTYVIDFLHKKLDQLDIPRKEKRYCIVTDDPNGFPKEENVELSLENRFNKLLDKYNIPYERED
jgi:hypothetical protein